MTRAHSVMRGAKSLLRRLLAGSGAARLVGRVLGNAGVIVMLHRVRQPGWHADPGMSVTPARLTEIIEILRLGGYDLLSLDDGLARMAEGGGRFACLTFDDGFRDNHDEAWPLLAAAAVPATIYATSGFIDGSHFPWWGVVEELIAAQDRLLIDGDYLATASPAEKGRVFAHLRTLLLADQADRRLVRVAGWASDNGCDAAELGRSLFLDWDQVRSMAAGGLVTFGAHTISHPRLSQIDDDAAELEISGSRRRLGEILGQPPRHFAFPFGMPGDCGLRDEHLVMKAGFTSAVRAYGGPICSSNGCSVLPRIPFGGSDDVTDLILRVNGLVRSRR